MKTNVFGLRGRRLEYAAALLAVTSAMLTRSPAGLTVPGSVVAWGGGQRGMPGGLTNVIALSTSMDHSLALKSDGTVVAWGANFDGQSDVPAGLSQVAAVAAGAFFSVALKSDGTVVAWGDNQFNQIQVPADATNVTTISAGRGHVLALKSDGTVEAWGSDIYGQADVPGALNNVAGVLAGWNYSLALLSDGTVRAWGVDDAGQTEVPAGLTGVKALAANLEYCLALKTDGTVVAWGSAPETPLELTGVKAIAAGENHCLALTAADTIIAWGGDQSGQTDVPLVSKVSSLGAGWNYSVALVGNGVSTGGGFSLRNASWVDGIFRVSVPTQSGKSYVLQYKALNQGSWSNLVAVSGTGQSMTLMDATAGDSSRVYRVLEQ